MQKPDESITELYSTDEYIAKNPTLHEEHSAWKINKITEILDRYIDDFQGEINLLDVGGGAGLILESISAYLEDSYNFEVNSYALDLSPRIIAIQKARNPVLRKALVEDIRKTSLGNKEIDLTLAIDLLEHVPNPKNALEEMGRISKFVMLKVPLEDNFYLRTKNLLSGGKLRKSLVEQFGHVNFFSFEKLKNDIENYLGDILCYRFTNAFSVRLQPEYSVDLKAKGRLVNYLALYLFRLSPKFCSYIFNDFVMIYVKCY